MKKICLILAGLTFFLTACTFEHVFLKGQSEHWRGEYYANVFERTEQGEYIFRYKDRRHVNFENLVIIINDGETIQEQESVKISVVRISKGCSGCSVTDESIPIKVTIKWDGQEEEFLLENK